MPIIGPGIAVGAGITVTNTPGVVSTGLIVSLDAGNPASYSGSGTVWADLSGNSRNAIPGTAPAASFPTFSTNTMVFNGSSQGTILQNYGASLAADNFTYEVWCKPNDTRQVSPESTIGTEGTSGQRWVIYADFQNTNGGAGISVGTNGVSVFEHGAAYMPSLLVSATPISSSAVTQIVVVYTNKQPTLYINGQFNRTGLTSLRPIVYQFGATIGYGAYGFYSGNIDIVKYFNVSLTASQVMQNYQALRQRFGV
jgi:hypothetical protein